MKLSSQFVLHQKLNKKKKIVSSKISSKENHVESCSNFSQDEKQKHIQMLEEVQAHLQVLLKPLSDFEILERRDRMCFSDTLCENSKINDCSSSPPIIKSKSTNSPDLNYLFKYDADKNGLLSLSESINSDCELEKNQKTMSTDERKKSNIIKNELTSDIKCNTISNARDSHTPPLTGSLRLAKSSLDIKDITEDQTDDNKKLKMNEGVCLTDDNNLINDKVLKSDDYAKKKVSFVTEDCELDENDVILLQNKTTSALPNVYFDESNTKFNDKEQCYPKIQTIISCNEIQTG